MFPAAPLEPEPFSDSIGFARFSRGQLTHNDGREYAGSHMDALQRAERSESMRTRAGRRRVACGW